MTAALTLGSGCTWRCLIGNAKKWREPFLEKELTASFPVSLRAARGAALSDGCHEIHFSWEPPDTPFLKILQSAGRTPLPPYITRMASAHDRLTYQTVYAVHDGSVAAPTAGMHFTDTLLHHLEQKGITIVKLTLHVGHGTFKPVTTKTVDQHVMHEERFMISRETMALLRQKPDSRFIAIGTTSVRTLESLYWLGCRWLLERISPDQPLPQWYPYQKSFQISSQQAFSGLIAYMDAAGIENLNGSTGLIIIPGYSFRVVRGMVTNFHLPRSTLLFLVSAFTGPGWSQVYQYALDHQFRFLSYGDACIFLK